MPRTIEEVRFYPAIDPSDTSKWRIIDQDSGFSDYLTGLSAKAALEHCDLLNSLELDQTHIRIPIENVEYLVSSVETKEQFQPLQYALIMLAVTVIIWALFAGLASESDMWALSHGRAL